ncbi:methyl-accepting chemotaxis protein [Halodesulfurarchaeum sp.]|uniref:methyl-accepting chemotaxis protein n=1 Tax=Halodesulfurarchaeum sp. TaxID=1980530 RepID=UPI001BC176ED|nr:HAMP domain-containing protein [Halodesulfurarchaeum sp.]
MNTDLKTILTGSVQRKLILAIGVTTIVVIGALLFVSTSVATEQVTTASNDRMDAQSVALSNDINTELKKHQKLSESLASTMGTYEKDGRSRENASKVVRRMAEDNPAVLGTYVSYQEGDFDSNQTEFAPYWNRYGDGNQVSLIRLNLTPDDKWYHVPMESGDRWVKGPYSYQDKLLVSFLTPIERNGEVVGVAGVDVSIGYMNELASDVQLYDSGYAFVVSNEGQFVAHPNESWVGAKTLGNVSRSASVPGFQTMEEDVKASESGNFTMQDPVTGSKALVKYHPIETGGFAVATVAPTDEVLGGVNQMEQMLLLLGGVALLALLGVTFYITRRVTGPIADVRDQAVALAQGDLDAELQTTDRVDEIGDLNESFTTMQSNLEEAFTEINTVSQNLAAGDEKLAAREVKTGFPGVYGDVMENLDHGATEVTGSLEEIQTAGERLQSGELDYEVTADRPGIYGDILGVFDNGMETLSASFDEISVTATALKNGKLSREFQTDHPGTYGTALTDLEAGFDEVNSSIANVQAIADRVSTTSEQVTVSTEEIETASEEVAQSVQEISQGSDEQSGNMQEAANELNDLSATVEEIAASATQVEVNASEAVDQGQTGRESASEATAEISQIETEAEEAVKQVSGLDEEMEQIGEIVQMINDIAEQTNLLALNASIEAARAGEAGEGFAVVADEIKALAGEAADATTQIEERINKVQTTTNETVSGIEEMKTSVESGAETIEETIQQFDDIAESIEEVEAGVAEISDATDDQAASTEEVVAMVDEVSSVAEETAAEASNVSAASEEQTASLSDVGENVEGLSKMAGELHDLVEQFKVEQNDGSSAMSDVGQSQSSVATDGGSEAGNSRSEMEWQGSE